MDNDAKLLRLARNAVKSARFGVKYRGVPLLSAQAGNDAIAALVRAGAPFYAGRCGATEMRCMAEYLQNGGVGFSEKIRAEMRDLSGMFPTDDAALARFCREYAAAAQHADLLALWDVGAERQVIRGCAGTRFTQLRALEPYYHPDPWSAALAGKKVVVIHPFAATIRAQYEKRALLFRDPAVLPQFASLALLPAVQGLGGQATGYESWFAALCAMQEKLRGMDFEVAIIGAGAYGLPLAATCKQLGRGAVQMSGATQLLFGIRGRRWDHHPVISGFYNDSWVRPGETEGIANPGAVEGGSYW